MKYFLDLEFIEDGKTIDPLSIAMVAQDGREIYVVNESADRTKASPWVQENVIPYLDKGLADFSVRQPRETIPILVKAFVGDDPKPEFWGYYADYDWVAFCQLFGTMMDLPKGFPMYCRDIKQWCDQLGNPQLPPQGKGEHHALLDARWNKQAYEFIAGIDKNQRQELILANRRLDWIDVRCSIVADSEYLIGPFKVGDLRKFADEGLAQDDKRQRP